MPCFTTELCWRVHLLSPFIYAKYCRKNFGKLVDHVTLPVGEYPIEPPDHPSPAKPLLASFLVPAIRRQQEFMEKMLARRHLQRQVLPGWWPSVLPASSGQKGGGGKPWYQGGAGRDQGVP